MTQPVSITQDSVGIRPATTMLLRRLQHRLARLIWRDRSQPALDGLLPIHQKDLGLTHSEVLSISSLPLSVDAMTILAIRDCGGTRNRQPDY